MSVGRYACRVQNAKAGLRSPCACSKSFLSGKNWVAVKAGLWTLDLTMDRTEDWMVD